MFASSKDLLLIVLSLAILGLAIFIGWAIYYLVMILKQINQMIADFRADLKKIDDLFLVIKEKIEHSVSYLGLLVEVARQTLTFLRERKEGIKKTNKK